MSPAFNLSNMPSTIELDSGKSLLIGIVKYVKGSPFIFCFLLNASCFSALKKLVRELTIVIASTYKDSFALMCGGTPRKCHMHSRLCKEDKALAPYTTRCNDATGNG